MNPDRKFYKRMLANFAAKGYLTRCWSLRLSAVMVDVVAKGDLKKKGNRK